MIGASREEAILLSPPHVGEAERRLLLDALDSGWVAPLGPHVDAFECELAAVAGRGYGAALNTGTAALQLALRLVGVGVGDEVFLPTLTFIATAGAVTYLGARPVLLDVSADTWTLDPDLVEEELQVRSVTGRLPAAVIAVDLYGQCADNLRLSGICERFGVPFVVDAAESLGATCHGRPAGGHGVLAAFSFNGNKIITTSGGGMLVGDDESQIVRARHLASQAREPTPHYEHREIGYNFRMSNLLAAVGRAQLSSLADRVSLRRSINARYREALSTVPGLRFMPTASYGEPTHWLSVLTLDPAVSPISSGAVRQALQARAIEARPAWKPMHLQPVFEGVTVRGGAVSHSIFETGLCLPSGSSLTSAQQNRVIDGFLSAVETAQRRS